MEEEGGGNTPFKSQHEHLRRCSCLCRVRENWACGR